MLRKVVSVADGGTPRLLMVMAIWMVKRGWLIMWRGESVAMVEGMEGWMAAKGRTLNHIKHFEPSLGLFTKVSHVQSPCQATPEVLQISALIYFNTFCPSKNMLDWVYQCNNVCQ